MFFHKLSIPSSTNSCTSLLLNISVPAPDIAFISLPFSLTGGNVMTQGKSSGPTNENVVMVPPPKDKRNVTLPSHFRDFVMPTLKKGNNK
ncbi:hypothetical protein P8452_62546 [Trifolium repens]|jgi:hypothetical protein|nr:hypothetical protein P8452_62546 [Trifolium repens]